MFDIDELVQIGLLEKDDSSNAPSCNIDPDVKRIIMDDSGQYIDDYKKT